MKVLLVEDEAMIAMVIEDILEDAGHSVVGPVGTVASALRLIGDDGAAFDCALLDVNLRGEASYMVADVLTERGVPFAFTSGYGQGGIDARFAHRLVLPKPIDEAKLLEFVQNGAAPAARNLSLS